MFVRDIQKDFHIFVREWEENFDHIRVKTNSNIIRTRMWKITSMNNHTRMRSCSYEKIQTKTNTIRTRIEK